ncbi:DUF1501 domain-containing protein [Fimbriiglobus ruber]
MGGGLGGIALAHLLGREGLLAADKGKPEFNGGLHHKAKAKRVVQLFMSGAASQVDTFDYKPKLDQMHGKKFDPGRKVELFQSFPGMCLKNPWGWQQFGRSGKHVSKLLPHIGSCADDIAFVHSMVTASNVHGPATYLQATGFALPGFPAMGAWVGYGLGSLSDNLPTFVVIPDDRGYAPNGPANWGPGFLPAAHQGTMLRPGASPPIFDLNAPQGTFATPAGDADALAALNQLNRTHAAARPGDSRLDARINAYELAAKLQTSAPEVLDLSKETVETKKQYGQDARETAEFGRNCLIARRLLERGVRFVQLWNGADNGIPRRNWDSHENILKDHGEMGRSMDQPTAALLKDLKQRGLLDDTIVMWTTEFGRMPCTEGGAGRDHNPFAFTLWLAGGGIKGGTTYGASDEWSYKVADKPTPVYDIHATILHLLGIDHTKLIFRHNGIDRRLTDVYGNVIPALLT